MSFIECVKIFNFYYNLKKYYLIMNIKQKFWLKIKEIRKTKNINQEKLSFLSWLHRTYISDVERWNKNISLENIEKISKALEIELKVLFDNI